LSGALSRAELAPLLTRIHRVLARHRHEVDALNVFPVPDGDTGSNMAATVRAASQAVAELDEPPPGEAVATAVRGAMRGARGNSGVILSQVLRALLEELDDTPFTARRLAASLRRARDLSYDAVADPVEGTVLTAIAAAAAAADSNDDRELLDALQRVRAAVHEAVARTIDQLDVLRDAGVVDAGARGFALVLDAVEGHLTGETVDEEGPAPLVDRVPGDRARETGSLDYAFEVQYLLAADEHQAPGLRERLRTLGDSVVVVGAEGVMTVHVHTNDVGGAIEAGLALGETSRIEVVHFGRQVGAFADEHGATVEATSVGRARLGCVVVLSGAGLHALAESCGATVVDGEAGRLPSVADLLSAVGDVAADRVAILPGHRNVIPTARQASDVAVAEGGRELTVVASASSIPAALAALAVCHPEDDPEVSLSEMEVAAAGVRSGEVVAAVRDADTPIGPVRRGQHLAVVAGEVVGVADAPLAALALVLDQCASATCEVVTLVAGAGVTDEERAGAQRLVAERLPAAHAEVVDGGQSSARYAVGIE